MARPKLTTAPINEAIAPRCPHCGGEMWGATVTVEQLMDCWPITSFVCVMDDGHANPGGELVVDCPACGKPSALAFEHRPDGNYIKLVACRTEKDVEFLTGAPYADTQYRAILNYGDVMAVARQQLAGDA